RQESANMSVDISTRYHDPTEMAHDLHAKRTVGGIPFIKDLLIVKKSEWKKPGRWKNRFGLPLEYIFEKLNAYCTNPYPEIHYCACRSQSGSAWRNVNPGGFATPWVDHEYHHAQEARSLTARLDDQGQERMRVQYERIERAMAREYYQEGYLDEMRT